MEDFRYLLDQYEIDEASELVQLSSGLINMTFRFGTASRHYILQKINQKIFRHPEDIAYNIWQVAEFLKTNSPQYVLSLPLTNKSGSQLTFFKDTYYRIFQLISGVQTKTIVKNESEAFEAAKLFGSFARVLEKMNPSLLKITLPDFHNLERRFRNYNESLKNGNKNRLQHATDLINRINSYSYIVRQFQDLNRKAVLKTRIMHHDTKISNVLFDEHNNGVCVIDLDTIMPGFFISDFGDMMRTYLSPAGEEEPSLDKICVRKDFYHAIKEGYLAEMSDCLNIYEKEVLFFSGKFMIFMQALRFITDYFQNDIYYGSSYDSQNYFRALNQITLLDRIVDFERSLL